MVRLGLRKINTTCRNTRRDEKKQCHRKRGGGGKPSVGKMAQEGVGGKWSCQTAPVHRDR